MSSNAMNSRPRDDVQVYDFVVVGGGLAGSAFAASVAADGAGVLILEKDLAFRDRARGEWLAPWGLKELRALGLEDALEQAGAHALPALAGRSLKPRASRSPEGDVAVTFSHPTLQQVLLDRAESAGARVIRGARVAEVVVDGGRGLVRFQSSDGAGVAAAPLVVGAEGRTSLVRRALGRPQEVHRSARLLAGVRLGGIEVDPSVGYFVIAEDAGGLVSLFPQGGGYARAYVFEEGADASRYSGPSGLAHFLEALVRLGVPAEAVAGATQEGPLAAFVADDAWVPSPASGPLVLIGDAAGASDPTWGMGMALAFLDARTLAEMLKSEREPQRAAARYAAARDRYFHTVITAEHWLTEIQLTPGEEAAQRRKHIMSAWTKEPERALDLPGRGPDHDVSAAARRRVFAEDLPAMDPVRRAVAELSSEVVANQFVDAVARRDFSRMEQLLGAEMRTRALLPRGPRETMGSAGTIEMFRGWFEDVQDFEVISTGIGSVADRVSMHWRMSLRWEGESFQRMIEQQAYAKVTDGRIVVLDLVCSGFRPAEAASPRERLPAEG